MAKTRLEGFSGVKLTNAPSAEKILSTLIELYADQMGVKIEYTISDKPEAGSALGCDNHISLEVARCG